MLVNDQLNPRESDDFLDRMVSVDFYYWTVALHGVMVNNSGSINLHDV